MAAAAAVPNFHAPEANCHSKDESKTTNGGLRRDRELDFYLKSLTTKITPEPLPLPPSTMPARERGPTSGQEVRRAARAAVAALAQNDIRCCIFGSCACQVYGVKYRLPKDVDIVLLTNDGRDIEYIKRLIVEANDKFYLIPSKDPTATYQKLYFLLPGKRSCKVDIILPGKVTDLNIPAIPYEEISYVSPFEDIPVMPLLCLLSMKVQGWTHHQIATEPYKRAKVPEDVKDILELLQLVVEKYNIYLWESWMPAEVFNVTEERVREFVKAHPGSRNNWRIVGFQI